MIRVLTALVIFLTFTAEGWDMAAEHHNAVPGW
jgi:hypothetical protein